MSPQEAKQISQRLNAACAAKAISPNTERVGRVLLWQCRAPDADEAQVSYTRLARLAGVGRTTAVAAVAELRKLGLTWRKTRLRVSWAFGVASRQWRNVYRWIRPSTEVAPR